MGCGESKSPSQFGGGGNLPATAPHCWKKRGSLWTVEELDEPGRPSSNSAGIGLMGTTGTNLPSLPRCQIRPRFWLSLPKPRHSDRFAFPGGTEPLGPEVERFSAFPRHLLISHGKEGLAFETLALAPEFGAPSESCRLAHIAAALPAPSSSARSRLRGGERAEKGMDFK